MKVVEFDGTDVWFEQLEPLWSLEEVFAMGQQRLAETLEAHGHPVEWEERPVYEFLADTHVIRRCVSHETGQAFALLPRRVRHEVMHEDAGDYRERIGWRRNDAKPLQRSVRKAALDKVADEFGIVTNEPGWEEQTLEAIRLAPARGRITAQT